jgi:hypothetical protein
MPLLPLVPAAGLVLYMLSDARSYGWYFFLHPRVVAAVVLLALPAALLFRHLGSGGERRLLLAGLLVSQGWLLVAFLRATGGDPLYRDDHPSFLYRLWLLRESFPSPVLWNPFWNGGYVGSELISTGAYSLWAPALPAVHLFGVERVYTPYLAVVFLVAIPWITYLALRGLGLGQAASLIGALLSLGVNRYLFLHLLSYGTAPSLLISFLVLVVFVILHRAVVDHEAGPGRWLALVAALQVMVLYPATPLFLLPLLASLILGARGITRRTLLFLGAALLFLLLVDGSTVWQYVRRPRMSAFLRHQSTAGFQVDPWQALTFLGGMLKHTNPLLLVAGLWGLLWPARRAERLWLLPPVLFFLGLTAVGQQVKPLLQLQRMVVPLSFLLIVPAASALDRHLRERTAASLLLRGLVLAFALAMVANVGEILRNRGKERYVTISREVKEMTAWIREHVPPEGRLMFADPGIHAYGGGHVAWLQAATGRGMIAGDYYHFDPRLTDYNPIPKAFRDSPKKLNDYFALMGVTHVSAYRTERKERLGGMRRLRSAAVFGKKEIFATDVEPGFILRGGAGRVTPSINRLAVTLDRAEEEVVLRFLWFPGLSVEAPATLHPVEVAPGLTFIGLRPHGRRELVIRHGR